MCQNYENWLAVDKVIAKIIWPRFFGPPCIYSATLISTPRVHVDPTHTLCKIFYDLFVIFLPNFMYSSPIHMSSWRLNITYLSVTQKPVHTILHWGPRGPQIHQFWKTMQAWVWLLTCWSLLLGNCFHITRKRNSHQFLGDRTATVWLAIGIIMSVCPTICRSVALCIVAVRVGLQD